MQKMEPVNLLQVALKNNIDVFYFQTTVPLYVMFTEDGLMDKQAFMELYQDKSVPELAFSVTGTSEFAPRFEANNLFLVHQVGGVCFRSLDMFSHSLMISEILCLRQTGQWHGCDRRDQPGRSWNVQFHGQKSNCRVIATVPAVDGAGSWCLNE